MKNKIKIGSVNYLNAKPLLYGIINGPICKEIELVLDYPSVIAEKLIREEIDIGLAPIAILPELKRYFLHTDYCIGATRSVASVGLFSDVPITEVKKVLLDYQSRTSIVLAKILFRRFWKLDVEFELATTDYLSNIKGNTAGVVIGDRAFRQQNINKYNYDLAESWIKYSGLSFLFAAWVSTKPLTADFTQRFNLANQSGLIG